MEEIQSFEQVIERLREPSPSDSVLHELSGLHGAELSLLTGAWHSFPTEYRQEVVSRLVEIGETDFETDFSKVFEVCLSDEDPRVRTAAIDGLWEVQDVALVRPLVRILSEDQSDIVREAAAISLSRFALLAELGRLQSRLADMVWQALWNAFHDAQADLDVRRRAVESLAYFSRPEVAQVIESAYEDEEDRMRVSAIFAMGRSADEMWGERVLTELERDDPEMRFEAARACGALRVVEAIPILSRMVADPDLDARLAAVWALGQIGGQEAQRVLEICWREGSEALQDAAEEALAELDFTAGVLDFSLYNYGSANPDEDESD